MLKEHLSETYKQLNRNQDEISFEEILQEAEAFVEAEHNAITLTGDIIHDNMHLSRLRDQQQK